VSLEPILVASAAIGTLVVIATFIVRGHEIGWELSAETVFVLYVRVASLAASVIVAIGLAELLRGWLVTAPLPAGFSNVRTVPQTDQLVRGATLLVSGGAFWLVHFFLPRPRVPAGTLLYLAFVIVGALAFGISTAVTLPGGLAPEIERLFGVQAELRSAGSLGGGLAALVLWLGHLWQLRGQIKSGPHIEAFGDGPLPPEPVGVGAPLARPPSTFSAGAAAIPPHDR